MKAITGVLVVLICGVGVAMAEQVVTWDFDTPVDPLILGSYGAEYAVELDPAMNYGGGTGNALKITKGPGGTLQIYLAGVWGLEGDDLVTASFDRFDDTPNGSQSPESPACRVWGHYNDSLPDDLLGFNGSASGNFDYGPGEGWDRTEWTWTIWEGHTGLMIECRVYDVPGDIVWIDNLEVRFPDHASCITEGGAVVSTENSTWSSVKALYRP